MDRRRDAAGEVSGPQGGAVCSVMPSAEPQPETSHGQTHHPTIADGPTLGEVGLLGRGAGGRGAAESRNPGIPEGGPHERR